ncbi:EAL domain-containing protein [Jeotgalibaca caeni]|uniref:EAL domain-containing protein n=1 Tax=Jeotgalibaca caeni TaxID=3028623 RepID=UPI00237DBD72|nr:EAL domain-containing protein [Jeotgalibaca caeni]MDE1547818.1 EAL domain-containing protein [Jeotgalibaca caeni]
MYRKEIEDLYFVYQPIVKVCLAEDREVHAYEVLLRSRKTNGFPLELFMKLIHTNEGNAVLLEKCMELIATYFSGTEKTRVCLNLHQDQLLHSSTWDYLEKMTPYSERLVLEITELPPYYLRYTDNQNSLDLKSVMGRIKSYGFHIALDDISSGQNTMLTAIENIHNLSYVKFSLLPFRKMEETSLFLFLKAWQHTVNHYGICFIVEGVEDKAYAKKLMEIGVLYQQGYYWGRGKELTS